MKKMKKIYGDYTIDYLKTLSHSDLTKIITELLPLEQKFSITIL